MTDYGASAPARARTEEIASSVHAVAAIEVDHAARNALLKIAGIACDIQNLIDIAASRNAEDYQRDAATSAARGLATLIGATCVAVTSESPSSSINVWLLGGEPPGGRPWMHGQTRRPCWASGSAPDCGQAS
jgi:hypothetical protein